MKLYRYSPIASDKECVAALGYIQEKLRELSRLVIEEAPPINTLKLFAHYQEEYDFMKRWVDRIGVHDEAGSPTSYYVKPYKQMIVNGDPIEYVGIRVADPYRSQVGCGDFVVEDYEVFRTKYLHASPYIREVPHQKYQMLELFHPDIDVLGYIVKAYG